MPNNDNINEEVQETVVPNEDHSSQINELLDSISDDGGGDVVGGSINLINDSDRTFTANGIFLQETTGTSINNNITTGTSIYSGSGTISTQGSTGLSLEADAYYDNDSGQFVMMSNRSNGLYPGLHPDLHESYNTLIESLGDNSESYEANRAIREALRDNMEAVNNNNETRDMMLSYIEYLTNAVNDINISGRSINRKSIESKDAINTQKDNSDLVTPMGFEYTYHVPSNYNFFKKIICKDNPTINDAIGLLRVRLRSELDTDKARIYNDGGLIEICSPVHKDKTDLYKWFDASDGACKQYKMMPHSKNKGSGGLHINMSYNKDLEKWKETYINFFIMIANYPEINWILNEPSDNRTANSLQRNRSFVDSMFELQKMEASNELDIDKIWLRFLGIGGKSYAVSTKDSYHFELRTFEMPRTKNELTDYIDFTDSLLLFCNKVAKEGMFIPLLEHPLSVLDGNIIYHEKEKTAVKDFNRLVRTIGLDSNRFKKYVQRNFKVRVEHYGKAYLT